MAFTLPKLPINYQDLEPYIDAVTMEIHHTKHHQAYIDKLNKALENYPDLCLLPLTELLGRLSTLPSKIKSAVQNNGGGHYNHELFFNSLKINKQISSKFLEVIDNSFGAFDALLNEFKTRGLAQFGSGWVWLIKPAGSSSLKVVSTSNQNNPLMDITPHEDQGQPLLGIDVWEHAYYLKFQNRRDEYLDNILKCIDWEVVEARFLNS